MENGAPFDAWITKSRCLPDAIKSLDQIKNL